MLLDCKPIQMSKLPVKSFDCIGFSNSRMGRKLLIADVNIGDAIELVLATSHLESPCPSPPTWDQMFSKERVAQAIESLSLLGAFRNVIFCGDMNWDDKGDGPFPLPDGWIDAWTELKPGENGWTYDTKANVMLTANRKLQKRLDLFVCKLSDFQVDSIEMIGREPIPGLTHIKERRVRNETRQLQLPVFPSDHFGLILTITYQPENI
jgi:tyrosyl-DNA phosphodiesterase 2